VERCLPGGSTRDLRGSRRVNDGTEVPANQNYSFMTATELVTRILEQHRHVKEVFTLVYEPQSPAGERVRKRDQSPVNYGSQTTAWYSWQETVMDVEKARDLDSLTRELLKHNGTTERENRVSVTVDKIRNGWIQAKERTLKDDHILAICSKCKTQDGRVRHIPMVDFKCPPSDRHKALILSAMQRLGQSQGALLESGESYHYYGVDLLSPENWRNFMSRCLLLSPYIDARYIAHRLLSGTSVLRLTTSQKKPTEPFVVAQL